MIVIDFATGYISNRHNQSKSSAEGFTSLSVDWTEEGDTKRGQLQFLMCEKPETEDSTPSESSSTLD